MYENASTPDGPSSPDQNSTEQFNFHEGAFEQTGRYGQSLHPDLRKNSFYIGIKSIADNFEDGVGNYGPIREFNRTIEGQTASEIDSQIDSATKHSPSMNSLLHYVIPSMIVIITFLVNKIIISILLIYPFQLSRRLLNWEDFI